MRIFGLALVLLFALQAAYSARPALASDVATAPPSAPAYQQTVDDNDDTRVEVQLAVLGIALGTVFVLGTGVYVLRKKLGLVPPPPEQGTDGHH